MYCASHKLPNTWKRNCSLTNLRGSSLNSLRDPKINRRLNLKHSWSSYVTQTDTKMVKGLNQKLISSERTKQYLFHHWKITSIVPTLDQTFDLYWLFLPDRSVEESSRTHAVVLGTSFILRKGLSTSGERRIHGANTIARELGDILLCSSSFATLLKKKQWDFAIAGKWCYRGINLHYSCTTDFFSQSEGFFSYLTRWKMSRSNVL